MIRRHPNLESRRMKMVTNKERIDLTDPAPTIDLQFGGQTFTVRALGLRNWMAWREKNKPLLDHWITAAGITEAQMNEFAREPFAAPEPYIDAVLSYVEFADPDLVPEVEALPFNATDLLSSWLAIIQRHFGVAATEASASPAASPSISAAAKKKRISGGRG